jgi:hypothetical protein
MEWLEVDRFINALEWWQMVLVFVTSILISILVTGFIIYLIMRFVDKRRVSFFHPFFLLFKKKPKAIESSDFARQYGNTADERTDKVGDFSPPTKPLEVEEPVKFRISELLIEIEHNLKTINDFSGDNLIPLKSDVWDAIRHATHILPINLRGQLVRVYFEIRLLNQTVRFSAELGHKSAFLDERYRKRIATIAEGLSKIIENIKQDTHIINSLGISTKSQSGLLSGESS